MNISSNVSSIQAHQTMLSANANNVANVNTDGFVPIDTRMSDESTSIQANMSQSDDNKTEKSQTDLAKELTDQIIVQDTVSVNVSAIKTKDDMLGTLLDMKA